jgi:hypothetical protein
MQRKGLGRFLGKGYYNLVHKDPYIHGLSAKGIKTNVIHRHICPMSIGKTKLNAKFSNPTTHILSPEEYDKLFAKDYEPYEISYATTRIDGLGNVNIFVKDSGDKSRNNALLRHEQEELRLFKGLVRDGIDKNIADELAHNLNPVKIRGVDDHYPLNPDT